MPLFEIRSSDDLVPFRQLKGGADLYESEIEALFWANPEDFTGEPLLCVARQPNIGTGGRPDIVALDEDARVVVVEIKRDVDRGQLAQCLEYAGWARTTSLDALAKIYHRGPEAFFREWQEFKRSTTPAPINRSPRLILVAREFDTRTRSAFDFLIENALPVKLVPVAIYEDQQSRKFMDVDAAHEPDFTQTAPSTAAVAADSATTPILVPTEHRMSPTVGGHRVRMSDLLDAGLVTASQKLVWAQPRLGKTHSAIVTDNGSIQLEDGRQFSSPSRAASEASTGQGFYDGWECWRVGTVSGPLIADLRRELLEKSST